MKCCEQVLRPITKERWADKDYFECSFKATHRVTLKGIGRNDPPIIRLWCNRHYKARMKILADGVIKDELLEDKNERQ